METYVNALGFSSWSTSKSKEDILDRGEGLDLGRVPTVPRLGDLLFAFGERPFITTFDNETSHS